MKLAYHTSLPPCITRIRKGILLFLLCTCSSTLYAQKLSPSEAADSARSFTDGKVLKVKPIQDAKIDYRVKILSPEGRVRNIIVDGDSGEVVTRKKQKKRDKKTPYRQQILETGL